MKNCENRTESLASFHDAPVVDRVVFRYPPGVFDYHRGMLADEVRTSALRKAIHSLVKPGDVVVDLGAGSGILSFFACEAGAARVYAVEERHTADAAALVIRLAGLDSRIQVIHGTAADIVLPELADVLITETLGAFALEEGILGIVADARRRLLKPGARILPATIRLMAAPVEVAGKYQHHIEFWSGPHYDVDFSSLRMFASNVIYTFQIPREALLAEGGELVSIDMNTLDGTEVGGTATFECARDGVMHGFAGWFSSTLAGEVVLTNAPPNATCWGHAFLPLERPMNVRQGDRVTLQVESANGLAWRWRGTIEGETTVRFDQTTWFSTPPCIAG